ncbi:hypothetical protein N7481_011074 [Penicillium waksmanii]|uniref:uncharacterized protein n=1 Tax=Penicillium waksmanii TaxID=69791 RepID=UPI0025490C64|nr:uncharacterized protein N7481_011074 [Penicillium waksmanii]KAJ5973864.1 hypothetical protein N7481_011074 [Penicillium waksmanii]
MKFSRALLALSALSNVAFAAPFTNGELQATNQSPNPEEEVKAHLEKRLTCQSVARAIWVGHGVLEAAEAFNLILELTGKVSAGSALVDGASAVLKSTRRSIPPISEYDMEALTANRSINSHEKVVNPLLGIKANDGTPALAHHYRLNGVKGKEDNRTRDYDIHHFEDGTAHLRVPFVGSGSSVTKRHDGAGVKIAFQHASVALAPSEYSGAAGTIATRWQEYAEQGHANVFGFMEKNNKEVFYYRSIVEGQGFGNNYEDVMACGDMSTLVGTFLGSP